MEKFISSSKTSASPVSYKQTSSTFHHKLMNVASDNPTMRTFQISDRGGIVLSPLSKLLRLSVTSQLLKGRLFNSSIYIDLFLFFSLCYFPLFPFNFRSHYNFQQQRYSMRQVDINLVCRRVQYFGSAKLLLGRILL